jgi:hypothetical protein
MPSDAAAPLRDIEHNIDLATQFVAKLDYEAFRDGARTERRPAGFPTR